MAGLLDAFDLGSPQGAAMAQMAQGLLGGGSNAQRFAGAGATYAQAMQAERARALKEAELRQMMELRAQQMEAVKRQQAEAEAAREKSGAIEQAYRGAIRTPDQQAMSQFGGPTRAAAQAAPGMQTQIDQQALLKGLMQADPMAAFQMLQPKPDDVVSVAPGGTLYSKRDNKPLFTAPKEKEAPTSVQEFQYAQENPAFAQWDIGRRKAGATNIGMPRIDIKMGDSVAGQIGPMAKDSRIQAGGAVTMFDAADRIQKALDSGLVSAGPLTSKVQTVKQLVQKVSGGNDESIRQTQQVIRALSKMAVEARKQLQGQGQVTENEAKAVERADGGNIDDLTTGELQDLVTLTKRAAHFTAKGHQELLSTMEGNEGTRGAAPFYKVRGLEPLLQHSPQLPQIGGAAVVDELVNKYRTPAGR